MIRKPKNGFNVKALIAVIGMVIGLSSAAVASAQEQIKPRILIIFDTSGSMAFYTDGSGADPNTYNTGGDGSWDPWGSRFCCPGAGNSRLFAAKEAMRQMIFATGDIEFALMKFAQEYQTSDNPDDYFTSGWYKNNQNSTGSDVLRYDEGTCYAFDAYSPAEPGSAYEWLCVEFPSETIPDNRGPLMMWMDHHEFRAAGDGIADSTYDGWSRAEMDTPGGAKEQELRANGGTPLATSMYAAESYLEYVYASDYEDNQSAAQCRPYSVILLTDGQESCSGNTGSASTALHTLEDAPVDKTVSIWVIGFAMGDTSALNTIASNGGTEYARSATSQAELSGVLYDIVSESILVEICNQADDDCDGQIDEDFRPDRTYCNTGASCTFPNDGQPEEDEDILCERPSECACDGIDNNCDGVTDEPPDGEDSWPAEANSCGGCDDGATACPNGPNEGRCDQGDMICSPGVGMQCVGSVDPVLETCNDLDDDCDGETDEDIVGDECGACGDGDWVCVNAEMQCCGAGSSATTCVPVRTPAAEDCNGQDDDCDGAADEDINALCGGCDDAECTDPNEGMCAQGQRTCSNGTWGTCEGEIAPTGESCNGQDDDCDGETDEGVIGTGCGICGDGDYYCIDGSEQCCAGFDLDGNCIDVHVPTVEACNGVDDDCDGATDEEIPPQVCMDENYEDKNGIGICHSGYESCVGGAWGNVNPSTGYWEAGYCLGEQLPSTEECNGVDDDCDGDTDEDIIGEQGCGPCGDGHEECISGILQCTGARTPEPEVCDDVDNNCNGAVDENLTQTCMDCDAFTDETLRTQCETGGLYGICHAGMQTCKAGEWGYGETEEDWEAGVCGNQQLPEEETCDCLDNDCDNSTDEELASPVGDECGNGCGVWECVSCEVRCSGLGQSEVCNGLDDNCNELTDEGIAEPCGGCVLIGEMETDSDSDSDSEPDAGAGGGEIPPEYADCLAARAANPEVGPGEGECQQGAKFCDPNADDLWGECEGAVGPTQELCDGLDNDCDAETDEEDQIEQVNEVCATAVGICTEGWWRCVDDGAGAKSLECCEEVTEEGLCVEPQGPEVEECDGLDNDCDGMTDEELPNSGEQCGNDLGICEPGTIQCVCEAQGDPSSCTMQCVGESGGADEECNGMDDDCDGLTDEDISLGAECTNAPGNVPTGECDSGHKECINGEFVCNANGPMDEICDGKDNDCDGMTDEELVVECPEGSSMCMEGECAPLCVGEEMQCPPGDTCVPIETESGTTVRMCVTDVCQQGSENALPCVGNPYWCDEGYEPLCKCSAAQKKCVGLCDGVVCPNGRACVSKTGQCQPITDDCYASGCVEGKVCTGGECVDDPCAKVSCNDGEYCNPSGECVKPCVDIDCPSSERCFEGECINPCRNVECDTGEVCNKVTGACEEIGACTGVTCKYYQTCRDGECVEDPCWSVKCPNGLMCANGSCGQYGNGSDTEDTGGEDSEIEGTDTSTEADDSDSAADTDGDTGPDNNYGMERVLATGAGGCLCSQAPGAKPSVGSMGLLFVFALGMGVRIAVRKRSFAFAYTRAIWMGAWLLGALLAFGCKVEPYVFSNGSDENQGTGMDSESDSTGGSESSDTPSDEDTSNDDTETSSDECISTDPDNDCDGVDDNCDGETDEGVDLQNSSQFCGSCENDCRDDYENAFGICEDSKCKMGDCAPLYQDVNGDTEDGCEYFCQKRAEEDRCNGVDLGDGSYKGVDDDCDGKTDENSVLATDVFNCGRCGNVCRASHVNVSCVDGECSYNAAGDCDENFYDLDKDTENGCEYSCTKASNEESLCDNKDDDCDGETDEGNPGGGGACYELSQGCTVDGDNVTCPESSRCKAGEKTCVNGAIVCKGQVGPLPMEECNGVDDNCNGEVDENLARSCSSEGAPDEETGVCRKGYERCENGVWGTCTGETMPSDELCDNLDNDCDGQTDEEPVDVGGSCGGAPTSTDPNEGACEAGVQTCVNGNTVCEGDTGPVQELCNNADDDCDGKTDEGLTEVCGGCDPDVYDYCQERTQGLCAPGYRVCGGGEFGDCVASIGPKNEVCNGFDDDCDGETDEGEDGGALLGGSCGTCGGIEHCLDGHMSCCLMLDTNGDCVEPGSATLETCNGIDDNCDGMTDNGIPRQLCDGPDADLCNEGVVTCVNGVVGCSDTTGDSVEVCDGMDNDCDGETDEDLTNPPAGWCKESCGAEYLGAECVGASGWRCDYDCDGGVLECNLNDQVVSSETLCDGLDNDCDGQTDENLTSTTESCGACGNNCADVAGANVATMVCVAGDCRVNECAAGWHNLDGNLDCEYGLCTASGPEGTTCDNIDNDCNGLTDEGSAATEICDGIDNDCDSQTDEGLTAPDICNSRCPGTKSVTCDGASGWACHYDCSSVSCVDGDNTLIASQEALCDGLDNNCDGTTDEGFQLWSDRAAIKGAQCTSDGVGECSQKGWVKCAANQTEYICCGVKSGATCATDDIIPETPASGIEDGTVPDGLDNDCDGVTDDGADGCIETVSITGDTGNFEVFAYEASRPVETQGAPCSEAQTSGEKPWTNISFDEARNACLRLNDNGGGATCSYDDPDTNPATCWDLCTAEQWYYSCAYGDPSATLPHLYPYGDAYDADACNGVDFDSIDGAIPTGTANNCVSSWNTNEEVADMSGNVEEWTLDLRTVNSTDLRVIRGGSYKTVAGGLTCGFDFFAADEFDLQMDQLGFRCCKGESPISDCQSVITKLSNTPADYSVTGNADQCSSDGWWRADDNPSVSDSGTDWELGKTSVAGPNGNTGCLWATLLNSNYTNNRSSYLYSPAFEVTDCAGSTVSVVWNMYLDVGDSGDYLRLEVRTSSDGTSWGGWTTLATFTADSTNWDTNRTAALSAISGTTFVQLRFRFYANNNTSNAAGAFIDNVRFVEN